MGKQLNADWLTEGWLDFEYKKYILLDYLQHVDHQFRATMLYPPLAELIEHYRRLFSFKESHDQVLLNLPKELKGLDFKQKRLIYEQNPEFGESLSVISELVEYALPLLQQSIAEGKDIYDFIEENIEFVPVGLVPVYKDEGYLFLTEDGHPDIRIFYYRKSRIIREEESLLSLQTEYLDVQTRSITNTPEHIKLWLSRSRSELPNPATYFAHSRLKLPLSETFLPLARRKLLRELESHAA